MRHHRGLVQESTQYVTEHRSIYHPCLKGCSSNLGQLRKMTVSHLCSCIDGSFLLDAGERHCTAQPSGSQITGRAVPEHISLVDLMSHYGYKYLQYSLSLCCELLSTLDLEPHQQKRPGNFKAMILVLAGWPESSFLPINIHGSPRVLSDHYGVGGDCNIGWILCSPSSTMLGRCYMRSREKGW